MTGKKCRKKKRHTPITSEKQRGLFGAEYERGKRGKRKTTGMSQAELKRHLEESGGKALPKRTTTRKMRKKR